MTHFRSNLHVINEKESGEHEATEGSPQLAMNYSDSDTNPDIDRLINDYIDNQSSVIKKKLMLTMEEFETRVTKLERKAGLK